MRFGDPVPDSDYILMFPSGQPITFSGDFTFHPLSETCGPVDAIPRVADPDPRYRKFGRPQVDEELLRSTGVTDFTKYAVKPGTQLLPDFFLD